MSHRSLKVTYDKEVVSWTCPAHRWQPLAARIPDFWGLGSAGVLTIQHVWGSQLSLILTRAALSSTPLAACRALTGILILDGTSTLSGTAVLDGGPL